MRCFVLAGGSGDALWPLSRKNYPKQFIYLKEGRSLFQEAIARNLPFCDEFYIITNEKYHNIVEGQLQVFQGLKYHCFLEGIGRQTAPAVAIACLCVSKEEEILVVSTDHLILSGDYNGTILKARNQLREDNIVAIGCESNRVSIEGSDREQVVNGGHGIFGMNEDQVVGFFEKKVNENTLPENYLLDSGIFLVRAGTFLEAVKENEPELYRACTGGNNRIQIMEGSAFISREWLEQIKPVSVGRAVYEQWSKRGLVSIVKADFTWSRILNFEALSKLTNTDKEDSVLVEDCDNVTVFNEEKTNTIVVNGLKDVVVVNTKDATYISKKGCSDRIRTIMEDHYDNHKQVFDEADIFYTAWGIKETLNKGEAYTVKKLTLFPGKSLSMHRHEKRSEHWSIVSGVATITMFEHTREYTRNESVFVPINTFHQISNESAKDVIVIEVSIGESASQFSEDVLPVMDDFVKLNPHYKDYLWGGKNLEDKYGKKADHETIAESWELSAHSAGQSVIAEGNHKGMSFVEYLEAIGKQALGWKCQPFERFPLLVKFIDAKEALSVQVHPGDEFALKVEGEYGKNEMWYILDAKEGAFLYLGFQKDITKEECLERIEQGTICDVLRKVYVKKGDVIFVNAGTIHAINEGIVLLEIQQSSNATYRLYDYNRMDRFGKTRELHIERAIENIDFAKSTEGVLPEGELVVAKGYSRQLLGQCKYFSVTEYQVGLLADICLDDASFSSIVILEGQGEIGTSKEKLFFKEGDSFFVAAGKKVLTVVGKCRFVVSQI